MLHSPLWLLKIGHTHTHTRVQKGVTLASQQLGYLIGNMPYGHS